MRKSLLVYWSLNLWHRLDLLHTCIPLVNLVNTILELVEFLCGVEVLGAISHD